jgi:hypothetical protein
MLGKGGSKDERAGVVDHDADPARDDEAKAAALKKKLDVSIFGDFGAKPTADAKKAGDSKKKSKKGKKGDDEDDAPVAAAASKVYKVADDDDMPEGAADDDGGRDDGDGGLADALSSIDLSTPLRDDEVLPAAQHRRVNDPAALAGASKGKKGAKDSKNAKLDEKIKYYQWHIEKLELIMRAIDNDMKCYFCELGMGNCQPTDVASALGASKVAHRSCYNGHHALQRIIDKLAEDNPEFKTRMRTLRADDPERYKGMVLSARSGQHARSGQQAQRPRRCSGSGSRGPQRRRARRRRGGAARAALGRQG